MPKTTFAAVKLPRKRDQPAFRIFNWTLEIPAVRSKPDVVNASIRLLRIIMIVTVNYSRRSNIGNVLSGGEPVMSRARVKIGTRRNLCSLMESSRRSPELIPPQFNHTRLFERYNSRVVGPIDLLPTSLLDSHNGLKSSTATMEKTSKIYIAGSTGMVGSAVKRRLETEGYRNLICPPSGSLNLIDQGQVNRFFAKHKPQFVVLAAGKVGGIAANDKFRAEFIYNNLLIEANVIHAAHENGVGKLIFLGSSRIYPKPAEQPIKEEQLLTGLLEPTNEPYAVAKIAGIKLCENYHRQYGGNFFSAMPTNIYGIGDNFDLHDSHVVPALTRKFDEAKINDARHIELWGTGSPRREFLYADDLADAVVFFMKNVDAEEVYGQGISQLNLGTGEDIEVKELAEIVRTIVGYTGQIVFDPSYPDGTPRANCSTFQDCTNWGGDIRPVSKTACGKLMNGFPRLTRPDSRVTRNTVYEKSFDHRHNRAGRKLSGGDSAGQRLRNPRNYQEI